MPYEHSLYDMISYIKNFDLVVAAQLILYGIMPVLNSYFIMACINWSHMILYSRFIEGVVCAF